jgi:hypothetical protein
MSPGIETQKTSGDAVDGGALATSREDVYYGEYVATSLVGA